MRRALLLTFITLTLAGTYSPKAIAKMNEPDNPYGAACDRCLKYCRGEPTCMAHCRVHDCRGRPYPGAQLNKN
jgi:hypothetical protein